MRSLVLRGGLLVVTLSALLMLLAACGRPSAESGSGKAALPEADSPGAQALKHYCGDCHAPPRPEAHRKDEWPNVVYRMQNHRIMKAMDPVPEREYQQLIAYLEKHARP